MTTYEELPIELKYIEFIEKEVPIKIVSVGPDRKQTILK
jgi:adenylosuccinate synthase